MDVFGSASGTGYDAKTALDVQDLLEAIRADPDFVKYSFRSTRNSRPHAGDPKRVDVGHLTPGLVRGEQLSWAAELCRKVYLSVGFGDANFPDEITARWSLASATAEAVPYLWKRDLLLTALSLPLPRHVVGSDLFPHDLMYWSPEREVAVINPAPSWDQVMVQAFLIIRHRDGYLFGSFATAKHSQRGTVGVMDVQFVPFGARYPEDLKGGFGESMLKLAAFVNSPFVSVDRVEPHSSKEARRRYGPRIGDPLALNVVRLRAEVREAVRVERGEGPRWKQRWLVRGHYRAQWYPLVGAHKVIWIAPYLKGPEDAPLKQPVYAVVR